MKRIATILSLAVGGTGQALAAEDDRTEFDAPRVPNQNQQDKQSRHEP
jgi:hypothetical protein